MDVFKFYNEGGWTKSKKNTKDAILFEDLRREAFNYSRKLLCDVVIFDSFYSKELGDKKSYALGFIFQSPSKTLTDKVVNLEIKKIFSKPNLLPH